MSATVVSSQPADISSSAPRRKSGRVSKKPEPFAPAPSPASNGKRKRNLETNGDVDMDEPSDEQEESESSEGEPDEEELRERRRKKKNTTKPKGSAKKPAAKKPKTNGESVTLAIRPATAKPKRPRKAPIRKSAFADENADGLYAEIFRGSRLDDVAAQWITSFREHEANAVAEIVNFVLRSAGCDIKIDQNDIDDPDNAPNKLGEIQDDYQAQNVSEYPLIAKRGGGTFKSALHGFFISLIQTVAQTGLLYENTELIENIQVWISTMSSAPNRPFRHTSTVVSLAITSALSRVARDIVENSAKKIRQSETESKKARVNKGRVSAVNKEVEELNKKLELVNASISDWFDTVFVHRYRDVDPKIRVDCVEALADWVITYPDNFFDGSHLRYLGWVLSDTHAAVRLEVIKQLHKLFGDQEKLAGLKTFTERFRPRIVEMATRDADSNVRAAAVDLLDVLREAGFLEPDDIDSIGKLIYDAEPKVRNAVVGFFAETVSSAYDLQIDDMGGEEALEDALSPSEEDDEFSRPRLEWLKLKCLVEQLLAYDAEEAELPSQIERLPPLGELGLAAAGIDSRFALAAQALFDQIPEIQTSQLLAGYLLYDHSQTVQDGAGEEVETMLRQNCKVEEREEVVLLDILNSTAKLHLERLEEDLKDKRKSKAQRQELQNEQAEASKRLSALVPQLLKKFGAVPDAATHCLRLERLLNLDVYQELRQTASFTALLDDVIKQFQTHHDERVLEQAAANILFTQGHEEWRDTVDAKVQTLWDDLLDTFNALRRGRDISKRGDLSSNILTGISNIVQKIAILARGQDAAILDKIPASLSKGKSKKKASDTTPPITSILQILDRASITDDLEPELDAAEDRLIGHAINSMLAYFLWKFKFCQKQVASNTAIPDDELENIAERRDVCVMALMQIMQSRKGADELRMEAAGVLLEIHTVFFSLKRVNDAGTKGKKQSGDINDDWEALCREIDGDTTKTLLQILTAAESNLAKRTRKRLEEPDVDDDPIDPDDEPESSDEEEEVDEQIAEDKQLRALLAEKQLCSLGGKLVRAVLAGTLEPSVVRKRMERNKAKLGNAWKEVVGYLDVQKSSKKAAAKTKTAKEPKKAEKSKEIVVEDDEDENEEEQGDEDEDMADEHVNGEANGGEEEHGDAERRSAEAESVLGD
ncbi:STAG-domain-containing protein [Polyplosphaeria fusca]|uniref:STAG-domain-containing protein n=1 Tax=Polyplosphaeria fusca TaxID=682080 RepID=A0A9P4V4C3_9PLEO|nr:STAG-domain-containing protein [Polyplosphaeria fusca]